MKQFLYGLALFIFLVLPPVANLMESIMIIHMHMQMPMLIAAGFLMAKFFQNRFPRFFQKWNPDGVPGIVLFLVVFGYWMIPRTMDEALTFQTIEWFKFISLTFLAGVPLRDSWKKLSKSFKYAIFLFFAVLFVAMGWLYIAVPVQLCNNYLLVDQLTLGWGFLTMAICIIIYLIYITFTDQSEYEND